MNMDEKKSKSTVIFIGLSVVCLLVIGYFMFTTGSETLDKPLKVDKMQELTQKVQGMESEVKKKEGDVIELVDQYQTKTGAKTHPGLNLLALGPEERELLEQEIGKEKDVSVRSLLKLILKKKDELIDLRERISEIEEMLPAPHIAQKGQSHYGIALGFLVDEKGVEEERAKKILARTALFDELAEGFKVWNFYTGEEYGTSVTQGDAKVSPNVFVHRAKKKLVDERDMAVSQRDKLADNIKFLEVEQGSVATQLDRVTTEKENLTVRVNDLNRQVHSVYYRLDSRRNLKKEGILKSGFLKASKLKDVSPDRYDRSLDLTLNDRVVISAEELGVKKIKDVVLYPRFYKKGKSYEVVIAPNKKHALLTLLDTTKFKSERVVIAVL
ncbi:MAG: hypothetical protein GY950_21890 [bacterium]|nr:hypothetical protein [bacterium]